MVGQVVVAGVGRWSHGARGSRSRVVVGRLLVQGWKSANVRAPGDYACHLDLVLRVGRRWGTWRVQLRMVKSITWYLGVCLAQLLHHGQGRSHKVAKRPSHHSPNILRGGPARCPWWTIKLIHCAGVLRGAEIRIWWLNLNLWHRPGIDNRDSDGEWDWDLNWGGDRRGCNRSWVTVNVDDLVVVVHEKLVASGQHLDLLPKVGDGLHLPSYVFLALAHQRSQSGR